MDCDLCPVNAVQMFVCRNTAAWKSSGPVARDESPCIRRYDCDGVKRAAATREKPTELVLSFVLFVLIY